MCVCPRDWVSHGVCLLPCCLLYMCRIVLLERIATSGVDRPIISPLTSSRTGWTFRSRDSAGDADYDDDVDGGDVDVPTVCL